MTLPASGAITFADICAEFGLTVASAIFPTHFYGLGGAPASGALGFHDFYGRSSFPAAPTFVGSTGPQFNIAAQTIAWPAGHAQYDVAILTIGTNNQALPSTPTGCTAISTGIGTGAGGSVNDTRLYTYWIRATSGSMATISIPDSGNITSVAMTVFRGCRRTGNPFEASVATKSTDSLVTAISMLSSPYIYGKNRTLFVALSHGRDSNAATVSGWTNAAMSSITEAFDSGTTSSNGGGLAAIYGPMSSQTTTGTTTATAAAAITYCYLVLALVPEGIPASGITPDAGLYGDSGGTGTATFTLTSPTPIVWNWTNSNALGFSSNVANGGTASSITFSLAPGASARSTQVQVTVGNYTWNIGLDNDGSGGGCVGMAMTMTL